MAPEPRKRLTLLACILGSGVVFLDSSVVNVALPALRADLDLGLAGQQWVIEAYLLTLGSLLLVGGSLSDRLGRRRVFSAGLAGFGLTSLLCAVAPSGGLLVAGRALQGAAGALLVPGSLAIITATFGERERGAAIGSWTAWTGVAFIVGPLAGGVLIDAVSWRLIFALNVPLVAGTLVLVARAVAESRDPEAGRGLDLPGALLCTLGLGGVVLALTEQPTRGWGDPSVALPLAAGIVCLAAFLVRERRVAHPMLPLDLFRVRNFAAANLATLAVYGGLAGSMFFVVLFIQQVGGYSALEAGLALMPITLLMLALSRRFGLLADRLGSRAFMAGGPIVAAGGLLLLLRVERDADYLGAVLPGVALFGLGLAATVAPLTATVLGSVEQRHAGIASGINNAVSRVAGLVAIAALGAGVSAEFAATLDGRLAGEPLRPPARAAVAEAKSRPLVGPGAAGLPRAERPLLEPAIDGASEAGFHLGMGLAAALVLSGGLVSAAGIRNPRRAPHLGA